MAQITPGPSLNHRSQLVSTPDLVALQIGFSDAAWRKESNTVAFGCIFKNREGQLIHQEARVERYVSSPDQCLHYDQLVNHS